MKEHKILSLVDPSNRIVEKEFDFRFGLSYINTSDFNRWHKKMCQSKNIEINAVKSRESEFGTSVRVQNCHFNNGKD